MVGLLNEQLAFGDAVAFDADAAGNFEPLGVRGVSPAQRGGFDFAFTVLEREFLEIERRLDFAGGRHRRRRRVAAGRDDVEGLGKGLFSHCA